MSSPNSYTKNNAKIIFKCDKHASFISEKLIQFYEENQLFDTVLIAGSHRVSIQAHRLVLCALSDHFLEILCSRQSASNVVELKDIEASTLKLIIDFIYSGSIELSLETVEEILRTASFLKIKTLIDGCCDLIEKNLNSSNSLKSVILANELNLSKLKVKALEFTYIYFEELSKSEDILTLNKNELMDLLFNDNPHGDIEEYVFLSIVAWINYDKSNREQLVFKLLSMVRFQALTPKFIIENRKSVCKTIESYELICSWLQWHLSPETRSKDQQKLNFKPRKMLDKLAVIKVINGNKINIKTFKTKINGWETEIETSLPEKRLECSVNVSDGKPIVVGGHDTLQWIYNVLYLDIQTLKWIDLPAMDRYRSRSQMVNLKSHLCVFGGDVYSVNSMVLYNFSTRKWENLQPLSTPSKTSQIAGHNGMLYLLDFEIGVLQIYDISSKKWTSEIVGKESLCNFGFSAVEGFLYVIGGDHQGEMSKKVKRYNLSDHNWCYKASLPQARSNIKTTVFENKIIICDSINVDEYNLHTDTWSSLSPLTRDETCEFVNICTLPAPIN